MVTAVHTGRDADVDDVQRALAETRGPEYWVMVTSPSTLKVQHGVTVATIHVAHSAAGTDLGVTGFGITHRVRHALESACPDQAELHRAYRWG